MEDRLLPGRTSHHEIGDLLSCFDWVSSQFRRLHPFSSYEGTIIIGVSHWGMEMPPPFFGWGEEGHDTGVILRFLDWYLVSLSGVLGW